MGTADKVCAAACAIADQSARLGIAPHESSMVLLELGGAFTAALAIDSGQIVDGMGGSSGPLGVRAAGALDGEAAYLLAAVLRKDTLYTGGALDPRGALDTADLDALWAAAELAEGWAALREAAAKAVRGLWSACAIRARSSCPVGWPAFQHSSRRWRRRWPTSPRCARSFPARPARPHTVARSWPTPLPAVGTLPSRRR